MIDALIETKLASSKREARDIYSKSGAVTVNDQK
jgi:hypothetical protein